MQSSSPTGLRQTLRYALPVILVLPVFSLIVAGLAAGTMGSSVSPPPAAAFSPAGAAQVVAYRQPVLNGQAAPGSGQQVFFLNLAPDIVAGAVPPHGNRGPCNQCHKILSQPVAPGPTPAMFTPTAQQQPASTPPLPSPSPSPARGPVKTPLQMMPFQRVYWQGLELVPLGHSLAAALQLPDQAQGVVVAGVGLPAGAAGFVAGDVVVAVGGLATPDLQRFWEAAQAVSAQPAVELKLVRGGQTRQLQLAAPSGSLGSASGVTAPIIVQGSQPPHGQRGACASCHLVVPSQGARP